MVRAAQVWRLPRYHRSKPPTKTEPATAPPAGPAFRSCATRSRRVGFSLVELLVVIAIVAILAGAVVTKSQPSVGEGLRSTARIVAADMDRARELAVANSSSYRISFDIAGNFYRLTHTGADSRLDTLPPSPFGDTTDPSTQWTQKLGDLPKLGPQVALRAVLRENSMFRLVDHVEFGPLGETAQSEPTVIWLTSGSGNARRRISITINPVTGVSSIGNLQATSH